MSRFRATPPLTEEWKHFEFEVGLGRATELEAVTQALLVQSEDHAEFYEAWSEGRKPKWTGR